MESGARIRASSVALVAVFSLGGVACGGAPPAATTAQTPPPAAARVQAGGPPVAAQASTGTVSISQEIRQACGIPDNEAYFSFDSASLLSSDIQPLDAVARCVSTGPLQGRALRLVGHADPRGAQEYNMTLGQSRADSVEQYLGRRGVPASKLGSTSRGAMDASGTDENGWARDRRVDVLLGG